MPLLYAETDLRLPKKKPANGQKLFYFRGANVWNSLSAESKQPSFLSSFKVFLEMGAGPCGSDIGCPYVAGWLGVNGDRVFDCWLLVLLLRGLPLSEI